MGYSADERETVLVYSDDDKTWRVYSTVGKHIRRLMELGDMITIESEDDRPIAIEGKLDEKYVAMRKPKVMSEEQKALAAERFRRARESKFN